jgi:hypothetical protein
LSKAADAAVALEVSFLQSAPSFGKKRISEDEWTVSLNRFFREARKIRRRFSLGLIASARTTYLFQQRLIGAGLPADIVRKVVFSLILSCLSNED